MAGVGRVLGALPTERQVASSPRQEGLARQACGSARGSAAPGGTVGPYCWRGRPTMESRRGDCEPAAASIISCFLVGERLVVTARGEEQEKEEMR